MRMHMMGIPMCCNNDFEAGNGFRELQRDLMGCFRCDVFFWREGLHHVVIHATTVLLVQAFGVHELL